MWRCLRSVGRDILSRAGAGAGDEWDADTILRVKRYMGGDPRVAGARIPEEFRASAVVEQDVDYDTGRGPLEIKYQRPETPEEVEQNVGRALEHVRQSQGQAGV